MNNVKYFTGKMCVVCKREFASNNIRECRHPKHLGKIICGYCCRRCSYCVPFGNYFACGQGTAKDDKEIKKVKKVLKVRSVEKVNEDQVKWK